MKILIIKTEDVEMSEGIKRLVRSVSESWNTYPEILTIATIHMQQPEAVAMQVRRWCQERIDKTTPITALIYTESLVASTQTAITLLDNIDQSDTNLSIFDVVVEGENVNTIEYKL